VTEPIADEYAPLQQRVHAAAETMPGLLHLFHMRVVVHPDVPGTAWLWASRRRWRIGGWQFGPPVPDEIRVSPHAAENACDDALRGLIAHEYGHLIAGHAESDWWRKRFGFAAVLVAVLAGLLHPGWIMAGVAAVVTLAAQMLLLYSDRSGELHAEGMAAQMIGIRPLLAALTYATSSTGDPGRRAAWPIRLFDTHPDGEAREAAIVRWGRRG
jgi:hypothetical protein